jgi:hypothetical protein
MKSIETIRDQFMEKIQAHLGGSKATQTARGIAPKDEIGKKMWDKLKKLEKR